MKKTLSLALAALLAVSALAVTGCTQIEGILHNPVDDANAAIVSANANLSKVGASGVAVESLDQSMSILPPTPEGAKAALEIILKLRDELAVQKKELQAAKKSLASIKALSVKSEFKQYAQLEIASIDTRLAVVDESSKLYDQWDAMYSAFRDKKLTNSLSKKISTEIDTISSNIALLSEKATTESAKAADYFEAQALGGAK
jgi:hypothetical protein